MKTLHWLVLRYEACPACNKKLTYLPISKIYECRNACGNFQISLDKFKEYVGEVFINRNDYAFQTKTKTLTSDYYLASRGVSMNNYK